ncbi:MAG TPA: CGNR zinc finger domain-containing protein [Pseudonocardia sp.]
MLNDYQLGASLATALVNTAAEVQSEGDRIAHPAALADFLAGHRVPVAGTPTSADVAAVHALRAELRALLLAPAEASPRRAVERAAALTEPVGVGPALTPGDDGRWVWRVRSRPGAGLADELALLTGTAVLAVLRTLGPDRFRRCASPDCAGVFVDTSRGGRRRYCEPEVCGNRVNVAAYRARRRAGDSGGRAAGEPG